MSYIRKLLQTKTATDEYFDLQVEFEKKFGEKTIVLYENGHFYEFYQIENEVGRAGEIADLLNMLLSKKDKNIPEVTRKNPQMAGFPTLAVKRHLPVLLNAGWTVVMVEQISPPPHPDRAITAIYSKGTYLDNTEDANTNYIMSIYLEEGKNDTLICGWSLIDLSTGYSLVYQVDHGTRSFVMEELNRVIVSYNPKEYLITCDSSFTKEEFMDSFGINNLVHFNEEKEYADYWKITFQNQLLDKIYPDTSNPIVYLDMERMDYARFSFIMLLQFCEKHGEIIIRGLSKPEIWSSETFMKLENNALEQLDIINQNDKCLFGIINKTSTTMGKRLLHQRILTPLFRKDLLTNRYQIVESMITKYQEIESILRGVNDLERLNRKIILGTIQPFELCSIYFSYQKIDKLFNTPELSTLLNVTDTTKENHKKILEFIENNIILESAIKYNTKNVTSNFIKRDNETLKDLLKQLKDKEDFLEEIRVELSKVLGEQVKLETTEKEGFYFKTTVKKGETLQTKLKNHSYAKFKVQDLKVDPHVKSCAKFISKELEQISRSYQSIEDKIIKVNLEIYHQIVKDLAVYSQEMKKISEIVSEYDFYKSLARVAFENNYVRPEIVESDRGMISATSVRHPIVEKVNTSIPFVANDINLDTQDGMLIYGINGIGKSVYLKSIGLSILLAQIGSFVPAKTFKYAPFKNIMTRILSNDNLYKGYSSFMVEMVELKNILSRASKYSLALADELTHGTETQSGTAIMAATIINLSKSGCRFCFTSHLHQLSKMDRIKDLKNVGMYNMKVEYLPQEDRLIYHRKLQSGAGVPLYGLECCKGLHLDREFLNLAMEIRKEILDENKMILDPENKSVYNADFYLSECNICGTNKNLHTHHIDEQQLAVSNGYIDEKGHKDSLHNLICLCETCHQRLHKGQFKIEKFDTMNGFKKIVLKEEQKPGQITTSNKYTDAQIKIICSYKPKMGTTQARRFLESEHKIKATERTIKKYWDQI
jgi:DNA mismatch repair protein MutS